MPTQSTTIDRGTADRLSTEFHRCSSTFDARPDLLTENAVLDLLPPMRRFRFEGPGRVPCARHGAKAPMVEVRV